MTLHRSKHEIEEINGILCTLVEENIPENRFQFLKKLLEHNGYTVQYIQQEDGTFRLGVTDLLFNPVIDVYKRRLKSFTNKKVTPAYWLQLSEQESEAEANYWLFKKPE